MTDLAATQLILLGLLVAITAGIVVAGLRKKERPVVNEHYVKLRGKE